MLSLSATHLNKDNDNSCSDRKLNKMLNGFGGFLEWIYAYTHYLHVGLRCGPSALWSRSKALKDVQFSFVAAADRATQLGWCWNPHCAQRLGVRGAMAQDPRALRTVDRRGPL